MFEALFALFVAAPLVSIAAWLVHRDRPRLVLMAGALTAVGLWLALIGLALTGWRDIDGAVDCWRHCDTAQQTAQTAFWLLPGAAIVFGFASAASLLLRR
jgi:hypothetical protein